MNHIGVDILSILVILFDLFVISFLTWRILDKKATLWGASRFIYGWVAFLTLYHGVIYVISLFVADPDVLINNTLHPFVLLFVLNPVLIAIVHWRGGYLWK